MIRFILTNISQEREILDLAQLMISTMDQLHHVISVTGTALSQTKQNTVSEGQRGKKKTTAKNTREITTKSYISFIHGLEEMGAPSHMSSNYPQSVQAGRKTMVPEHWQVLGLFTSPPDNV